MLIVLAIGLVCLVGWSTIALVDAIRIWRRDRRLDRYDDLRGWRASTALGPVDDTPLWADRRPRPYDWSSE